MNLWGVTVHAGSAQLARFGPDEEAWNRARAGEFIPLAEETGLIGDLTEWVARRLMSHMLERKRQGIQLTASLNLSARLRDDLAFPDRLAALMRDNGLGTSELVLEVTESAAVSDMKRAMDVLTRLRLKGFGLSMDDFGTDYSSLVQLARLPFTELKIDKSFVIGCASKEEHKIIVRSSMALVVPVRSGFRSATVPDLGERRRANAHSLRGGATPKTAPFRPNPQGRRKLPTLNAKDLRRLKTPTLWIPPFSPVATSFGGSDGISGGDGCFSGCRDFIFARNFRRALTETPFLTTTF